MFNPEKIDGEVSRLTEVIAEKQRDLELDDVTYTSNLAEENIEKRANRDLRQFKYNFTALKEFFGTSSLYEILKASSPDGKISVLELGAGEGVALSQIKGMDVDSIETTAVEVDEQKAEMLAGVSGVDKVENVTAEAFLPEHRYNLIYDMYGSVSYTQREFRKDLILKYCHSLKKGGVMLIAFDFYIYHDEQLDKDRPWIIQNSLSPTSDLEVDQVELVRQIRGIETTLEKMGFKAIFYI
ncbi:MAG: hypothetical protein QG568_257 [Patescibacteria group bacterium]|nr:hypothetical protein [Patescibacteria group bacterium]